jgi:two-component system response regulator RegX3
MWVFRCFGGVAYATVMAFETSDAGPAQGRVILVVEDEPSLVEAIAYSLERDGFAPVVAGNGTEALERFRRDRPALILLDLMLPGIGGLDVCRMIRAESDVPILMLTAKSDEVDKVVGLELGADDYVTKPFSMRELLSRIRANLRRVEAGAVGSPEVLRAGPVEMDLVRREVRVRGGLTLLPRKEFELLRVFLQGRERVLSRELLIENVWGSDYVGDTKTLDVHVKRLRAKVEEDPGNPVHLLTVRGVGYRFVD